MYSDIKSLLEKENMPEIYDMKNECKNEKISQINNSIDKYFIYKSVDEEMSKTVYELVRIHSKENLQLYPGFKRFDCDTCDLMKAIYKKLWKNAIYDNKNSGISGEFGDTMTSFQTTLNY